jgi:hypothetical protein
VGRNDPIIAVMNLSLVPDQVVHAQTAWELGTSLQEIAGIINQIMEIQHESLV